MKRMPRSEKRKALIQAATEVMSERGVAGSRLSDIASRASISTGQVLYYFESKSDLLVQALSSIERQLRDEVLTAVVQLESTRERWELLLDKSAPRGPRDFRLLLWIEAWALAPHDDNVVCHLQRLEQQWHDMLMEILTQNQDSIARQINLESFVTQFSALMDGLTIQVVSNYSRMSRERMLELCWDFSEKELNL